MFRISGDSGARMPIHSSERFYRRYEAHRASSGTSNTDNPSSEPHATSPNVGAETEPHQPRVRAGKSPVHGRKLRP